MDIVDARIEKKEVVDLKARHEHLFSSVALSHFRDQSLISSL